MHLNRKGLYFPIVQPNIISPSGVDLLEQKKIDLRGNKISFSCNFRTKKIE